MQAADGAATEQVDGLDALLCSGADGCWEAWHGFIQRAVKGLALASMHCLQGGGWSSSMAAAALRPQQPSHPLTQVCHHDVWGQLRLPVAAGAPGAAALGGALDDLRAQQPAGGIQLVELYATNVGAAVMPAC